MVDLPEADEPERPIITGWRMAGVRANEEEEGGKGLVGWVGVDNGERGNGEAEENEETTLVDGVELITVGEWGTFLL